MITAFQPNFDFELMKAVAETVYDAIWNEDGPPENTATLEGFKATCSPRNRRMLGGITPKRFRMMVRCALDKERADLLAKLGRCEALQSAASSDKELLNPDKPN